MNLENSEIPNEPMQEKTSKKHVSLRKQIRDTKRLIDKVIRNHYTIFLGWINWSNKDG